jgi:3-hydroxyacyl-CoA dehydrogenase
MLMPFRTVAVLGAGVMGSQIAAHLANAGLTVYLLDLPASSGKKNDLVEAAYKKALKLSPPICFTGKTSRRVILGNFDEDFHRLAAVDWVIEAIVEHLPTKQALMERLEAVMHPDAIISTNTSGLPIQAIADGRTNSFRRRFLGTHFFNPPRYLKLLELIPTDDTDPKVLARMAWFGEVYLGKGIVLAKDTPNFIANRIGMYATLLAMRSWTGQEYSIAEIDTLTGTLVGRPKSATFRTADLIGLDTLTYVADHLYPAIGHDESRDVFQMPDILRNMVATGTLGAKTGQGFYKKQKSEILALNPETFAYEATDLSGLSGVEAIAKIPDLSERLHALYRDRGRAGEFFRQTTLEILAYSARRIPEIADRTIDIDRALRWGFGWELGPFEIWETLGFEMVLEDMRSANILVPDWIEILNSEGGQRFYQETIHEDLETYEYGRGFVTVPNHQDVIDLTLLKTDPHKTLWQNSEAALLDLGDGVVMYEFRSKGNTLSFKVIEGLSQVLDLLISRPYKGLVIGNGSAHFSGGANLAEMGGAAQSGNHEVLEKLIVDFQNLLNRLYYFPKPVVTAVKGRVLGGACELVMASPHVVADAETYIGLVELSVGLIPGAGGLLRSIKRAVERSASESPSDVLTVLKRTFETIAMAKVSTSAYEGIEMGYLPPDTKVLMDGDRHLAVAKAEVLHLDRLGYRPPNQNNSIMVLGMPARAVMEHAAYVMQQAGYASEYDRYLASRLAYVITGGELSSPALVSESYLLQLERETFLPLLQQTKTQERIAHILKTKKPLRN